MYAMTGKRNGLVEILLHVLDIVAQFPERHAYIVSQDITDETCVWVLTGEIMKKTKPV
jgi:hypothetical protein